LTSTLQE